MSWNGSSPKSEHALSRHPAPVGGLLGLAMLPAHAVLPPSWSTQIAALVLVLIAGIYVGFAAQDGRLRAILVETTVASTIGLFALWSVLRDPAWLPAGYFAHAVWDLAHHRPHVDTRIPHWYVPFCVVIDVVVGAGLALIWWVRF